MPLTQHIPVLGVTYRENNSKYHTTAAQISFQDKPSYYLGRSWVLPGAWTSYEHDFLTWMLRIWQEWYSPSIKKGDHWILHMYYSHYQNTIDWTSKKKIKALIQSWRNQPRQKEGSQILLSLVRTETKQLSSGHTRLHFVGLVWEWSSMTELYQEHTLA